MRVKYLFPLLAVLFSTGLFAQDSDLDGVSDAHDKCPNTPFSDLVDINGCTKSSLAADHHYDIIVGLSSTTADYSTLDKTDTLATTLQADYYYKNFSLQAATSYYKSSANGYTQSGLQDSFLGVSYQLSPVSSFMVRFSAGAILPTYDTALNNNKTDYTAGINLSYTKEKLSVFGGYLYTVINDTDYSDTTLTLNYQDTTAYLLGLGYNITNKLYLSGAYNISESIYLGYEKIKTASLYAYYSIDQHWFSTFAYTKGLSDSASDNYLALKVGYYF